MFIPDKKLKVSGIKAVIPPSYIRTDDISRCNRSEPYSTRRRFRPGGVDQEACVTASRPDPFAVALAAQVPALRRYALALVREGAAADDLVQDCIERALRQAEKLEDIQRIGGWLRTILHNLHVDELRRRRRQGVRVDFGDATATLAMPARDPGLLIDFDRAMGQLTFEHRQVLLLVGLEGLNYREVAEELGIPIGTVMSRLARGREKLREAMEEKNPQTTSSTDKLTYVREP